MDFFDVFCYTVYRLLSHEKGGIVLKETRWKIPHPMTLDAVILLLGTILLIGFAVLELLIQISPLYHVNAVLRALMLFLICVVLYCGGRLRLQRTGDRKTLRHLFLLFFFCYLYLILTLTLIDETLGRGGAFLHNNAVIVDLRAHYVKWFVNLVPFRSIYEVYILGFLNGYVNTYYMLLNLVGNVCALMPLALFLPLFFRSQRKWYFFLPTVILFVVLIEALQFIFMVGSCDIDDLILNAGGAVLLYFLLRLSPLRKLLNRFVADCFEN